MGGIVSTGANNDELVDNLLEAAYIKTSSVENVFRAVDRAQYFVPEARIDAYKDLAWRSNNLHISAPCVYAAAMEGLELQSGCSFLNLGSGTGYLSTMAGLILGINGINHGIELHREVVEYANEKLDEFKTHSGAIDEYDFCEPRFMQGNCLSLTTDYMNSYDRVYCGAACPEEYENYMKQLLRIKGVLVMPVNDKLMQFKRVGKSEWISKRLLPVSFAVLITPLEGAEKNVKAFDVEPLPLQGICRAVIRNKLRSNIERKHPPVKRAVPKKVPKKKSKLSSCVVPLFDENDSSDDDQIHLFSPGRMRALLRRDIDRIVMRNQSGSDEERSEANTPNSHNTDSTEREDTNDPMETENYATTSDSNNSDNSEPLDLSWRRVRAVIEHHRVPEVNNDNETANDPENHVHFGEVDWFEMLQPRTQEQSEENENVNINENEEDNNLNAEAEHRDRKVESNDPTSGPSTSGGTAKQNSKREKTDSGLGDEIVEAQVSSSDDEEELPQTRNRRDQTKAQKRSSSETEPRDSEDEMRMYETPYTGYMSESIQELPLPSFLKKYLNFFRDIPVKNRQL